VTRDRDSFVGDVLEPEPADPAGMAHADADDSWFERAAHGTPNDDTSSAADTDALGAAGLPPELVSRAPRRDPSDRWGPGALARRRSGRRSHPPGVLVVAGVTAAAAVLTLAVITNPGSGGVTRHAGPAPRPPQTRIARRAPVAIRGTIRSQSRRAHHPRPTRRMARSRARRAARRWRAQAITAPVRVAAPSAVKRSGAPAAAPPPALGASHRPRVARPRFTPGDLPLASEAH
jgi:hypothetical protein